MQRHFHRKVVAGLLLGFCLLPVTSLREISQAAEPGKKANSNCRVVKRWRNKGALGTALPGQHIVRCRKQARCGAALCSANMTCAGPHN